MMLEKKNRRTIVLLEGGRGSWFALLIRKGDGWSLSDPTLAVSGKNG